MSSIDLLIDQTVDNRPTALFKMIMVRVHNGRSRCCHSFSVLDPPRRRSVLNFDDFRPRFLPVVVLHGCTGGMGFVALCWGAGRA